MSSLRSASTRKAIIENIRHLNRLWLEGHIGDISRLLDDDVVMCLPESHNQIAGKKDCIRALKSIRKGRNIKRYDELDYNVSTRNGISIVHYRFRIDYEMKGEQRTESGIDLLVFLNKNESWRLVRRSVVLTEC